MAKITLNTTRRIVPMIYAYTTPEIAKHNGWTKIGYTEQDVNKRISQQTRTADVKFQEEWRGNAVFEDGSGEVFHDTDFHAYLRKLGVENNRVNEWFKITGPDSHERFYEFKLNRGILKAIDTTRPYRLRDEQQRAVEKTLDYAAAREEGEFLWNAKPRFGKTLSVYDFVKKYNAKNILIVTNRPAIANSWYDDYVKFMGSESGYLFVSDTDSLKGKPYVLARKEYVKQNLEGIKGCIEFLSLQDLKGSLYFGGQYDKLKEVRDLNWNVLVIDEAHEGVDTYKTDVAFHQIKRKFTLHLSGTPFKAIASDKFDEEAIFNWTYADEQNAKRQWKAEEENPYANLPKLNLFTYQMSEIIADEIKKGVEIDGETEEYAFDLNEFFETKNGKFTHEEAVERFLDALTTQEKFPFSTDALRDEIKHSMWLLNRVESAKALHKKLKAHPVFREYEIVLAAGDGRTDEDEEIRKSFDKVTKAIAENDKTITLSVGQLTTGVTIPEWSAVLMLSNIKSPALYMQAAFRAQNPCLFQNKGEFHRKQNAYVFDFDPARTLITYEKFANDLSSETSDGRGGVDKRKQNIRQLLNFFPVIGEDDEGEMVELNAEKVLSIPRKIKAVEVVRRGFMSDFLFQNISNVFYAPKEVLDIIRNFVETKESKKNDINSRTAEELHLDEHGEVNLSEPFIIGKSAEIFGDKIFDEIPAQVGESIAAHDFDNDTEKDDPLKELKKIFHTKAVEPIIDIAKEKYGSEISTKDKERMAKKLKSDADVFVGKAYGNYVIEKNILEKNRMEEIKNAATKEEVSIINIQYEKEQHKIVENLKADLSETGSDFAEHAGKEIIKTVEISKRKQEKKTIEDSIRNHLRGFARTIPSFIMAYGTEETTLANFDKIVPDAVFQEVTSISLEQFCFLRDGGEYPDEETGETKHFDGKLFDPVVFDDSVKEFLRLKKDLADYFEEGKEEDIFDYIPPQKTNQIYTPKRIVKKMVDMLEEENPGCFDMPEKTFIDLYMKSGLYIAEIVKRLYQSENMKKLYPNKEKRLNHIFEKQVYGLAPTEIIYRIALSFILGFSDEIKIEKHNLIQLDALPYAKEGALEQKLEEVYPER